MAERSILITGCSSGIGYDAAVTLRRRGWRVFASARKAEDCARLKAEGFESPRLDYADAASLEAGLGEVLGATGGRLDALYNNGAFGVPALVEDLPRDVLREIFETNLFGLHDLTTRVIPVMRAQGKGRIVNCSSVLGCVAYPWRGAYISTKFALEGLTDTLRLELHGSGIAVSLIEPGLITTKFGANSQKNFQRLIDWEASARADEYREVLIERWRGTNPNARLEVPASHVTAKIVHAVESPRPRARYRVTKLAQASYILKRLLPTRAADALIRRLA
ncbi:MAG: SDR family NAD(P)-dependent oxidoreductase [Paracoccaceae bacterium]|nr:SDR family NAD(P)-dependent oxidoreductase [Paracoccaceae bacterium]